MPAPATTEPRGSLARHATTRGGRLRLPLAVAATAALGTLALHLRDPNVPGSWGVCPFRAATGLDCPGCGTLRAVHALTDGDVGAALSSNLLTVVMLPVAVALWGAWTAREWRGSGAPLPGSPRARLVAGLTGTAVLLLFGVLRNLPGAGWLLS